jgi:multiple sugar transport system ATP-binding protein
VATLRLDGIHKVYPGGHVALEGVDLAVADGELVVLVGPSGCGKSTALRLVAGLETPTRGRIWLGERDVTDVSPRERDVAMVFQSYALYPHKSVRENLAFGLRMRGAPAGETRRRVAEAAARLGLEAVLDRRPAQLSGGQRQRVALGRALVREPQAFLLDEPLSNLDAKLRVEMRAELAHLHRALGATMLYVTHDQEEAMTLGDRVAVLHAGRLEQVAPPLELYRRPSTRFVADFVGTPRIDWLEGSLEHAAGAVALAGPGFRLKLPEPLAAALAGGRAPGRVALGVRPHDLAPCTPEEADLRGRVDLVEALGSALLVHVRAEGDVELRVLVSADEPVAVDDPIALRLRRDRLHLFDAESGARIEGQGPP